MKCYFQIGEIGGTKKVVEKKNTPNRLTIICLRQSPTVDRPQINV